MASGYGWDQRPIYAVRGGIIGWGDRHWESECAVCHEVLYGATKGAATLALRSHAKDHHPPAGRAD